VRLGLHGKPFGEELAPKINTLLKNAERSAALFVSNEFQKSLDDHKIRIEAEEFSIEEDPQDLDAIISFGGDGTILEVVSHVGKAEIPVLGINTGRLGFLSETASKNMIEAFDTFLTGDYTIDERMLLKLETNTPIFGSRSFALNDFTLQKKDSSSMIIVHAYIDGSFLNSYWSDGLIVATPTGSTGYSMSCGGPILLPNNENFILTPVSPHNLTARPLLVSSESKIELHVEGRQKNFLVSLDSRYRTVDASIELSITKERFYAKLIRLSGSSYFETLRQKLNWGKDNRN